jgi:hypothetical protein
MRQMLTAMPRHNATLLIEPNNGYIMYQIYDSLLRRIQRLIPLLCTTKIYLHHFISVDVNISSAVLWSQNSAKI